jgi:hypothetical protein
MTYFLAFLTGFAGLAFGGRPRPGEFLMKSKADSSHRDSVVTGFIPALNRACLTAKYYLPDISAISLIVKYFAPLIVIFSIIGILAVNITFCNNLLKTCVVETENIFKNVTESKFFR